VVTAFVDTNVFIRLLTGDDPVKAEHCFLLLQSVQRGETVLYTSESIIAEVAYVLTSRATYRFPRDEVVAGLNPLLALPGLRIDDKEMIFRAIGLWEITTLDFEDCLAVVQMQKMGLEGIFSYDRGLDRVSGINRLEP
jgi:predicted nucleic-acid-binding protein